MLCKVKEYFILKFINDFKARIGFNMQDVNYTAKGLETILEVKILKFSVRKEQDRLAESILNYFFGEYDMKGILIPA